MSTHSSAAEGWVPPADKTSQTDDERIRNVTPLPPPEHLIRFFPIRGTAIETLVARTRKAIRKIVHCKDDRMLVIIGPCSIHDPAAAMEYARKLLPCASSTPTRWKWSCACISRSPARPWAGRA